MPTLRDGVLAVRNRLGEGNAWLYQDVDIVRDLNRSASTMVRKAQANGSTYPGSTTAGQQEYEMPLDFDTAIDVRVNIGTLYPITFTVQQNLQYGSYVSALPLSGYFRRGTVLTSLSPAPAGEVVLPPSLEGAPPRWILGLYPLPSQVYSFFVDYYATHPIMQNPLDQCLIPDDTDIFDGWVAYAIAQGKEKQQDYGGADRALAQHRAGVQLFCDYMLAAQWQINPPVYGGSQNPLLQSPSVVVFAPVSPRID